MANVQIDNGEFTRIANVILEKLSSAKLNGCQYAIILVVLRFTYGFQRKEHDLSLTFIENATGFDKRQIQRNLKLLEDSKIITQKVKSGITRTIGFNKDYESWTYGELTHGKKTVGEKTYGVNTVGDTADLPIVTYGENAYQERKVLKDNFKERILPLINFHKINYEKDEQVDYVESYLNVMDFEVMEDAIIRSNGRHINYLLKILRNLVSECKTSKSTLAPRFVSPNEQEAINAQRRAEEVKNQTPLNYEPEYVGVGNGTVPAGSN